MGSCDVVNGEQDSHASFQQALVLLAAGDPEAALELVEHVIAVEGSLSSLNRLRARALFGSGRLSEAADALQSVLEQVPDDDECRFQLGLCLLRQGHLETARDELAMAFVMHPSRPEYAQALSQVKALLRDRALASGEPGWGPRTGEVQ